MTERERTNLLFGPYQVPRLMRGDRATCLYRDTEVVVCGMSNGRIRWPLCRAADRSDPGNGLLVDEGLARAVRNESAAAVCYWWGASKSVVLRWRRALGVTRTNNPGTHRLIRCAIGERLKARFESAPAPGARVGPDGPRPRPLTVWSAEERALLGVVPDIEASERTGRSLVAVHHQRKGLGRPAVDAGPKGLRQHHWTDEEDQVVRTLPVAEAAQRLNRSRQAIRTRRQALGVAEKRDLPVWSESETALLGVLPDAEVARRTGRTLMAVKNKRLALGSPVVVEGPKGLRQRRWTVAEDRVIRTQTVDEAVQHLNRSRGAILLRRRLLGVAESG
jgi:hypothetical protein